MTISDLKDFYLTSHRLMVHSLSHPVDQLFSQQKQMYILGAGHLLAISSAFLAFDKSKKINGVLAAAAITPICLQVLNVIAQPLSYFFNSGKAVEIHELLKQKSPYMLSILCPFSEELQYRAIFQNGCDWMLRKVIPYSEIKILGCTFTYTALASIFISNCVFGSLHYYYTNSSGVVSGGLTERAILATLSGFMLGALYNQKGFAAAFFAHSLNNYIVKAHVG